MSKILAIIGTIDEKNVGITRIFSARKDEALETFPYSFILLRTHPNLMKLCLTLRYGTVS